MMIGKTDRNGEVQRIALRVFQFPRTLSALLQNNLIYLELRGLCVCEVQRLKDIDDERHQVLHNVLVVPAQGIWGHVISCQTY